MLNEDLAKKEKILTNLKKSRSLVNKIIQMIEGEEYCIDIMQQTLAVIGLMRSAHASLMESHLKTCFKDAMAAEDEERKKEMIEEILQVIRLVNK